MSYDPQAWKQKVADQRSEAKRDWSDPAKVQASMRLVLSSPVKQLELGRMLAALVHRHAPENLGLLPPAWHPQPITLRNVAEPAQSAVSVPA